ncbi:hypothetical protein OKW32_005332 [Paraburkholderia youngii]
MLRAQFVLPGADIGSHERDHWRAQTESNRHDQVFEPRGCGITRERGRAGMRADRRASQRHQGVRQYRIQAGEPADNEYPPHRRPT